MFSPIIVSQESSICLPDMIGTFLPQNTEDTFDAVVRRILKKNMYVVDFLPYGEYAPVSGTPFDFRSMRKIGEGDPDSPFPQLRISGGINRSFRPHAPAGKPAAAAYSPATGIRLDLVPNSPELELYTGDYLQVRNGKNGHAYPPRSGFALEPRYAPDSVHAKDERNRPIVRKGQTYYQEITFAFSAQ